MSPLALTLLCVLVLVLCIALGKWLFKKDDQWERRAEALLDLSASLQEYGLIDIPRALRLAAIKDISGVFEIVGFYLQLLKRDPTAVSAEFDKVFARVLDVKLADQNQVAAIQALINARTVTVPVADKTDAKAA